PDLVESVTRHHMFYALDGVTLISVMLPGRLVLVDAAGKPFQMPSIATTVHVNERGETVYSYNDLYVKLVGEYSRCRPPMACPYNSRIGSEASSLDGSFAEDEEGDNTIPLEDLLEQIGVG